MTIRKNAHVRERAGLGYCLSIDVTNGLKNATVRRREEKETTECDNDPDKYPLHTPPGGLLQNGRSRLHQQKQ